MNVLALIIMMIPLTYALDPVPPKDSKNIVSDLLFTLERPLGPRVDCFDPEVVPACEDITRSYCEELRMSNGYAQDSFGTVNLGPSEKSALPQLEKDDLNNLVNSQKELSSELKERLLPHFNTLSKLLTDEKDEPSWYEAISRIRKKIHDEIEELAETRAKLALGGPNPTRADKVAEKIKQRAMLMDEVTAAKMKVSPNWATIQRVFKTVKTDLESVIQGMPLTDAQKEQRLKNLRETKLSPPFGMRLAGELGDIMDQDCRSNMMNALFLPEDGHSGQVTICAGMINGLATESSAYFILAHELAHSFDQKRILQQERALSALGQKNSALVESNAKIACDDWKELKGKAAGDKTPAACGEKNYQDFMKCVAGTQIDDVELNRRAAASAGYVMDALDFCAITRRDQGGAFMNPAVLAERNVSNILTPPGDTLSYVGTPVKGLEHHFTPAFEVAQELRCGTQEKCSQLISRIRAQRVETAEKDHCYNVAMRARENESDWFAQRAVRKHVSGISQIRERREFTASSVGLFCGYYYQKPYSERDLQRIQRIIEAMGEGGNHSESGDRLGGFITPELAQDLNCTYSPRPKNYQSCEL